MRLTDFIVSHREQILSEWITFAGSCLPVANSMDLGALRDHAAEMLNVIAEDLNTPQSKIEQVAKAKGESDADPADGVRDTPAQAHGAGRAESGFSMQQMVSEYRALRASVTRLWIESAGQLTRSDLEDLIRFNEAIDQALAESTVRFTDDLAQAKDMFLAMLGHDLRTPLTAMVGWAQVAAGSRDLPDGLLKMASLAVSSGQRMNLLIGDLLDFTRSRLGSGIPIVRGDMDIETVCRRVVQEAAAVFAERTVNIQATGDVHGFYDSARIAQMLSNIISNAFQYGSVKTAINVSVRGEADEVIISVQNWGPVIPASQLDRVFDPMYRIEGDKPVASRNNLGLGLYISERIVAAHGGSIRVESSEEQGTIFTIRLPRTAAPPHRSSTSPRKPDRR